MPKRLLVAIAILQLVSAFLFAKTVFADSTKIRVNLPQDRTLTVRDVPAGTKIGSQRGGNEGTLVGSVQTAGGRTWQQVNFDSDLDGWVASEFLVPVGQQQQTVDCAQGTLPRLDYTGDTVWGRDWVPIGDWDVHTYCFELGRFSRKLQMLVADRTGQDQCTWNTTEYIPPQGSSLKTEVGIGRGSGYSFYDPAGLPQGTWRIRITEADTPGCPIDRYLVLVHP